MKIEHLNLFIRIATTQNISQAGKDLGLSAAVASIQIKSLEEHLGVRLVHRTTRKVSLTEEGQAFLPYAVEVLACVEGAKASVGSGSLLPQGKLRITAPASFGRMHIVPALAIFLKQYPDLSIDMHLSDRIVDIVEGGFDIAIRDAELKDSSYIARQLAPVKRIVCASPDYLKRHGTPQTPEDLNNHFCVTLMGLDTWSFENADKSVNEPISMPVKSRFRTDNGEAARDACVSGLGITLCSTWCCYQEMKQGALVEILGDYPLSAQTAIWAVYPSSRLIAPKVRAFIDFMRSYYGDEPYWD